jgi:hypothetical protein
MKTGTVVYNILHHRGIAIAIGASGILLNQEVPLLIGIILFTHASFDRVLGYGLKYSTGFKHTHLDRLTLSNEKLSEL